MEPSTVWTIGLFVVFFFGGYAGWGLKSRLVAFFMARVMHENQIMANELSDLRSELDDMIADSMFGSAKVEARKLEEKVNNE